MDYKKKKRKRKETKTKTKSLKVNKWVRVSIKFMFIVSSSCCHFSFIVNVHVLIWVLDDVWQFRFVGLKFT